MTRRRNWSRRQRIAPSAQRAGLSVTVLSAVVILVLAACANVIDGRAASPLTDPLRVGGLPISAGPSGVRDDAPDPTGELANTDGGELDRIAMLAVNDVEQFWSRYYGPPLEGSFDPVERIASYDSTSPLSPAICGMPTFRLANAFYCFNHHVIAWDRGVMLPIAERFFGDMAIPALVAHEYGHAVQYQSGLIDPRRTPVFVAEQQADCFAGAYIRWVAEGESPRFTVNTGDSLTMVLAAVITIGDDVLGPEDAELVVHGHGSAFERVSAFQMGFVTGTLACAGIDMDEVEKRRGDLPLALTYDEATGDVVTGELPITRATLDGLVTSLNTAFQPEQEPALSFDEIDCAGRPLDVPAVYCPDTNTIAVDRAELHTMGTPASAADYTLIQGDNTAYSIVTSRYMLALQEQRGLPLDTAAAALRTACLTGAAHRRLAVPIEGSGLEIVLTAGDLDEAVAGLLLNGKVASDVHGDTVASGFARVDAFRVGVLNDIDACYQRYP